MTPACAGMPAAKKRAAVLAAARRIRPTALSLRTRITLSYATCGGSGPILQLEAEVQIVLRAVLVEGARLSLVQGVVLEGRIVQVHGIERDREVIVHGISQRRGQGADGILRERRAAIQAAVERGPIGVRDPSVEHPVLEI